MRRRHTSNDDTEQDPQAMQLKKTKTRPVPAFQSDAGALSALQCCSRAGSEHSFAVEHAAPQRSAVPIMQRWQEAEISALKAIKYAMANAGVD